MDLVKPIDDIWKFKNKEIKISKMDIKQVAKAALHAMKKMHNYNKYHEMCIYKLKISDNPKQIEYWTKRKLDTYNKISLFATKLEFLDQRSEELNNPLPETFNEIKLFIDDLEKVHV